MSTGRGGSQGASDFPREYRLLRGGAGLIPKRPRPPPATGVREVGRIPLCSSGWRDKGTRKRPGPAGAEGRRNSGEGGGSRSPAAPSACEPAAVPVPGAQPGGNCAGRGGQGSSLCGQRLPGRFRVLRHWLCGRHLRPSPPSLLKALPVSVPLPTPVASPRFSKTALTRPLTSTLWKGRSPLEGVWTRALRGCMWGVRWGGPSGRPCPPVLGPVAR